MVAVTPENQLILLLARGSVTPSIEQQARELLATPLQWQSILEKVTAEEVYPLFNRNFSNLDYHSVPNEVRTQLYNLSRIQALRSRLMTEELTRVLGLLASAGIATVPLKGVALAEDLYGDPSMRVCVDMDILVPPQAIRQTFRFLLMHGYASEFPSGFFADLLLRHDIEYALRRQDHGIPHLLELHWGIVWGGRAEKTIAAGMWPDAFPTTVCGAPAYALPAEWQLLILATHAARHQWQGLKWLVDIHDLCCSKDIAWEKVRATAEHFGWEELLSITLHICHTLFETSVPSVFTRDTIPSWVGFFPASAPDHWSNAFFATRFLKTPLERLRYVARVLLIPTLAELRTFPLPSFLGFLYYPLRPLRLACKWSWQFVSAGLQRRQLPHQNSLNESGK